MIKKAKKRKSSKPPRPDKLPGPIKYTKPLPNDAPRALEKQTSDFEIAWSPETKPKKRR